MASVAHQKSLPALASMSFAKVSSLPDVDILGGGFKYFLVHPYLGKVSNLTNIFQMC